MVRRGSDTASNGLNANGEVIGATEVALNPDEPAGAAQTDPVTVPTPVQGAATAGPDWIQIGTEGGFLPAPVVVDGQQPTTWITDPTRSDVGNVDQHLLPLAPAERADAIVDFSKFAGQTPILYNDAPAAFPARAPSYDYYTGAPDLKSGRRADDPAWLWPEHPDRHAGQDRRRPHRFRFQRVEPQRRLPPSRRRSGVFESSVDPIIVGQAPYNLGLRHRLRRQRVVQQSDQPERPLRRLRPDLGPGWHEPELQHPGATEPETGDPHRAQGHARRDELDELRRVRPDDRDHRLCLPGHARVTELRPVPARQPADGAHRHDEPAPRRRQGHADHDG